MNGLCQVLSPLDRSIRVEGQQSAPGVLLQVLGPGRVCGGRSVQQLGQAGGLHLSSNTADLPCVAKDYGGKVQHSAGGSVLASTSVVSTAGGPACMTTADITTYPGVLRIPGEVGTCLKPEHLMLTVWPLSGIDRETGLSEQSAALASRGRREQRSLHIVGVSQSTNADAIGERYHPLAPL